jgi:hypothetical protein
MGVSESSESGRGGQGRAARQKGGGQRKIDLNTGRYGQSLMIGSFFTNLNMKKVIRNKLLNLGQK